VETPVGIAFGPSRVKVTVTKNRKMVSGEMHLACSITNIFKMIKNHLLFIQKENKSFPRLNDVPVRNTNICKERFNFYSQNLYFIINFLILNRSIFVVDVLLGFQLNRNDKT
jgi:hypothetical protein